MPDDNSPILDYASPRKRMPLRLPALSTLIWNVDRDEVIVREMLHGRSGAVGAILFAIFTMVVLVVETFMPKGFAHFGPYGLITPIVLAVSELTLIPLVIHQTWRRTILTVRFNEMLLAFTSPLHRKHYRWTGDDIADILLVETGNVETQNLSYRWVSGGIADMQMVESTNNQSPRTLAELLITRVVGGDIHLFTDHMASEIKTLVNVLAPMFREGRAVETPASPQIATPVLPDPSISAAETSARLIDRHREIRKRYE